MIDEATFSLILTEDFLVSVQKLRGTDASQSFKYRITWVGLEFLSGRSKSSPLGNGIPVAGGARLFKIKFPESKVVPHLPEDRGLWVVVLPQS